MTYQPTLEGDALAGAGGFAFVLPQLNTSPAVGSQVPFITTEYQRGSGFITLSGGAITLASGSVYYVEGTVQVHSQDGVSATVPQGAKYQWHQGGSPVGSWGRVASYKIDAYATEVGDEKAITVVDATAGDVTIEMKITATFGAALIGVNYNSVHNIYGGYGRAVIIQLEAP
jgi:hypothetical protein